MTKWTRRPVDVDGNQVMTFSAGDGPRTLLMAHGGPGCPSRYLRDSHDALIERGLRLVTWDQLGCGESDRPSGPAVAGLADWALERDFGEDGFLPARFTINLMRPARKEPLRVKTRELRRGRRARYADCEVLQGDDLIATAVVVLYQQTETPEGRQWSPTVEFYPPPDHEGDDLVVGSDAGGWVNSVPGTRTPAASVPTIAGST